ncbi:MAG: cell wall hydrolase [Clostridia bacterium]|nr:cell wall hydrolase [Clostridia bacterium]
MKKRIAFILCIAMTFLILTPTAQASSYRAVNVYINGKELKTQDEARIINDTTYVPLRAICELFGADNISWNEKTRTATIYARGIEIYITQGNTYIVANGRYFASDEPVKNIGGRLYLPVRLIAAAFASSVEWNGATYTVNIKDTGSVPLSGDVYYDKDEVYWLSRIIYAESGAEPFRGQIAVGNVVLNRVESSQFPNSVYGVIFDKKFGVQFSPVASGTIYKTPSASAIAAAKICLEGYSVNRDVLYFMNPDLATNNWISKNRKFAFRIGSHSFYY